jgi:hypothetical protein
MTIKLMIRDELPVGKVMNELVLEVANEQITVRELIKQRVFQEVTFHNFSAPGYFRGLIQPTNTEATLNGYKLKPQRQIDWEKQAELAIRAFETNGFFILIDDHQMVNLDDLVEIGENTRVTFLKLVPLVGG